MKTYLYLLINKDDMSGLRKYSKLEDLVSSLAIKKKPHHCIVIKNEEKVLKFPKFNKEPYPYKCQVIRDILNETVREKEKEIEIGNP